MNKLWLLVALWPALGQSQGCYNDPGSQACAYEQQKERDWQEWQQQRREKYDRWDFQQRESDPLSPDRLPPPAGLND